jgi:hypothetical protein
MGLAGAYVADKHDILVFRQVVALGRLQHACLIDRGDDREIELVQSTDVGGMDLVDETLAGIFFPLGYLPFIIPEYSKSWCSLFSRGRSNGSKDC